MSEIKKIAIFQKKEIRKTIHNSEWWFVIEDVVFALTDSKDPKQYIQRVKQRDAELKKGWVQIVHTLSIETSGGQQKMICANTEEILTAEISKATFGMTSSEYKELKKLKRENLKDHMNDLELIFSMLGERATTEITQTNDSQGFDKLKEDAKDGGKIAGDAKKALEKKTGKKVSTNENYLDAHENKKRIE